MLFSFSNNQDLFDHQFGIVTLKPKECVQFLFYFRFIKGTHTVYFSSSLYIINQKPLIPRIHFHCITTWVARSSGRNSAMHLLILWFRFTCQMALLSNINFYFVCKTRLCLIVLYRQEKIYFCTRKFLSTRYTR